MTGNLESLIQLQKKINEYEVDFDLKRTLLENKFEAVIKSAYEQRAKIIAGISDNNSNTNNNCNKNNSAHTASTSTNKQSEESITKSIKVGDNGVEGFWYEAFMNSRYLSPLIQNTDKDALMYLMNVEAKTDISKLKYDREYIFRLEFTFAPNPYFYNNILTKTYFVNVKTDKDNPLHYDGPRIYKSSGCEIKWKSGMDLTILSSNKKSLSSTSSSILHSGLYYQGALKKWVEKKGQKTFFNYFNFPEIPENVVLDDGDASLLDDDFQLGWHLKDELIPQALFYYLGDITDEDSDASAESSGENSADSEESSDENESETTQFVERHDRVRSEKPLLCKADKKCKKST